MLECSPWFQHRWSELGGKKEGEAKKENVDCMDLAGVLLVNILS